MENENGVVVNFFEGRAKTLWLLSLSTSAVVAVAGWLLAFLLPVGGTETHDLTWKIILLVLATAATGILLVCLITAKTRTSRWEADRNEVRYYAFGRKLLSLQWSEMREAGLLKIVDPRRHVTAYYLYWTTEELMSACRDFIKGGVMEHRPRNLGKYNRRKGTIILYALDPERPTQDPLLTFTQQTYLHPLKNPRILRMAEQEEREEQV
ncbi:MAG: hypothetical protein ACI4NG_01730 [Candidatus Gallimonas sp.]